MGGRIFTFAPSQRSYGLFRVAAPTTYPEKKYSTRGTGTPAEKKGVVLGKTGGTGKLAETNMGEGEFEKIEIGRAI